MPIGRNRPFATPTTRLDSCRKSYLEPDYPVFKLTKYCPTCGSPNDDGAKFCVKCGAALPPSSGQIGGTQSVPGVQPYGAQPVQPSGYQQPAGGYQPNRFERAVNIFTKNLGLILPMVILFIADIVVGAIVGVALLLIIYRGVLFTSTFLPLPFLFGGVIGAAVSFVSWFLLGIFLSLVVVESRNAVTGAPFSLSGARAEMTSRFGDVLLVSLILGAIGALFSFVPFVGWLITGLALMYFVVVESLMFTQGMPASSAISATYRWLSEMASQDGLSFVILLIAALLSGVPVLNFFTVPYATILLLVYLNDRGSLAPPAPGQVPPSQPYGVPPTQ